MTDIFLAFWYPSFCLMFIIMLIYKILRYKRGDYGEKQSFASRQIIENHPKRGMEIDIKFLIILVIASALASIFKIYHVLN